MQNLFLIALAGAAGALSRYGLAGLVQRLAGPAFPYGTFTVNMVGSFLFGLIFGLLEFRLALGGQTRMIALTGFMGAFTTFSTFAFETQALLRDGQWILAAANAGGQVVLGVVFVTLGLGLSRII